MTEATNRKNEQWAWAKHRIKRAVLKARIAWLAPMVNSDKKVAHARLNTAKNG